MSELKKTLEKINAPLNRDFELLDTFLVVNH